MLDTKGHKICAGYKHAAVKKYVSEKLLLSVYRYVSNAEYFGSVGTYSFNFHWQNLDFHFRGYKSLLCTLGVGTWQLEYFLSLVSSFVKKKGKKKKKLLRYHFISQNDALCFQGPQSAVTVRHTHSTARAWGLTVQKQRQSVRTEQG